MMSFYTAVLIVATIFSHILCLKAESLITDSDIHNAIKTMGRNTPKEQVERNIRLIDSSGFRALPFLLAEINNQEEVSGIMQVPKPVRDPNTGNPVEWRKSNIGDFAFDSVRSMIEGRRSTKYAAFYVIERPYIEKWLKERIGKKLIDLRIECAKLGLVKVKNAYLNKNTVEAASMISVFERRISAITGGESPDLE